MVKKLFLIIFLLFIAFLQIIFFFRFKLNKIEATVVPLREQLVALFLLDKVKFPSNFILTKIIFKNRILQLVFEGKCYNFKLDDWIEKFKKQKKINLRGYSLSLLKWEKNKEKIKFWFLLEKNGLILLF